MSKAKKLSIDAIFPQLSQLQQQNVEENPKELRHPFYAAMGNKRISENQKYFYCNKPGHFQVDCDKRKAEERKTSQRVIAFCCARSKNCRNQKPWKLLYGCDCAKCASMVVKASPVFDLWHVVHCVSRFGTISQVPC